MFTVSLEVCTKLFTCSFQSSELNHQCCSQQLFGPLIYSVVKVIKLCMVSCALTTSELKFENKAFSWEKVICTLNHFPSMHFLKSSSQTWTFAVFTRCSGQSLVHICGTVEHFIFIFSFQVTVAFFPALHSFTLQIPSSSCQ